MSTVPPIQEMPPAGGFQSIIYQRIPCKKFWTFKKAAALLLFAHFPALLYRQWVLVPNRQKRQMETRSCQAISQIFFKAERQRAKLLRVHENREVEANLMKDVPGWVVGTWFGEPIFKTIPEDEWEEPDDREYFIHTDFKDYLAWENLRDCILSF